MFLKKQMPEMFKSFDLGVNLVDRKLSINDDLFESLERQQNALRSSLNQIENDHQTAQLRTEESANQLLQNLPNLSEAIPPANSRGALYEILEIFLYNIILSNLV